MSLEGEESVKHFNEGLKFDGERYEVPLLWKRDAPPLKSNYLQTVKRLEGVERQFRRNAEKANAYKADINQYVEKGFAVEVKEAADGNEKVRYLPHHAVFREDKKTTVLFLMLQPIMSMRYLLTTVSCQGQHFNLTWYQYYFDSEHVG